MYQLSFVGLFALSLPRVEQRPTAGSQTLDV